MTGEVAWAYLPMPQLHSVLVVGRDGGPAFLRNEITHAERVVTLALKTLSTVVNSEAVLTKATELTAALATGRRADELTTTG
jgi:hypothetical protein